ncbi:hypothetical protein DFH06DRAFT_1307976 [Mycena polygramma]|nr:hypothetical protein DFH06DRAFT_1307976 [Mycena polygramma]
MHRALEILEVVEIVCSNLSPDIPGSRATLAALAISCKIFHDPALHILWRTQRSLVPLLSCMPQHLFNVRPKLASAKSPLRLLQAIRTRDWDRAFSYAIRVENFCFESEPGLANILPALNLCFACGSLYPHLKRLSYASILGVDFGYIRIFLTHTLVGIDLQCSPSIIHCSMISALGRVCPGLKDIEISFGDGPDCGAEDAISDLLCSLHHLTSVSVPCPDLPALKAIAQRPSITSLHLWRLPDFALSNLPTAPWFLQLRSLAVDYTDVYAATTFLQMAVYMQLRSLDVGFEDLFSVAEMEKFFKALAGSCSHSALESVSLATQDIDKAQIEGAAAVQFAVTDHLLRMLTCFGNITTLNISSWVEFDVGDSTLEALARAWPRLNTFKLCLSYPRPPDWPLPLRVTVQSLYTFARYCPNLRALELTLNATTDPLPSENIATPRISITQECLTELGVNQSPISNPPAIAGVLSGIFPNLRKIVHTPCIGHRSQGCDTLKKDWATVAALLPHFAVVRKDERARAGQRS